MKQYLRFLDKRAIVGGARKVPTPLQLAIVLSFWIVQLNADPFARRKVDFAYEAHDPLLAALRQGDSRADRNLHFLPSAAILPP